MYRSAQPQGAAQQGRVVHLLHWEAQLWLTRSSKDEEKNTNPKNGSTHFFIGYSVLLSTVSQFGLSDMLGLFIHQVYSQVHYSFYI